MTIKLSHHVSNWYPMWWPGLKNSPTVAQHCSGYWIYVLDINYIKGSRSAYINIFGVVRIFSLNSSRSSYCYLIALQLLKGIGQPSSWCSENYSSCFLYIVLMSNICFFVSQKIAWLILMDGLFARCWASSAVIGTNENAQHRAKRSFVKITREVVAKK